MMFEPPRLYLSAWSLILFQSVTQSTTAFHCRDHQNKQEQYQCLLLLNKSYASYFKYEWIYLEMSEREEKIKKEVKTDEYGNVRKEEVRREVSTKSEAERDLEDAGDKMKAGAKAMGAKMEDPDRDMGAQYEKKKAEEKLKD